MVRHEACPALLHCLKSAPYSLAATDKVLSHPSLPAGLTPICLSYQLQGTFGLRSHPHPICLVLMEGRLLKCEPEHIHYICWPLEPICPPLIRPQAPGPRLKPLHCPPMGCTWLCPDSLSPTCPLILFLEPLPQPRPRHVAYPLCPYATSTISLTCS